MQFKNPRSTQGTKRVKTSDKTKGGNKLLYKRNKDSVGESKIMPKSDFYMYAPTSKGRSIGRGQMNANDFLYYKRSSNISPDNRNRIDTEAQGSQMKTFYSNTDETLKSNITLYRFVIIVFYRSKEEYRC